MTVSMVEVQDRLSGHLSEIRDMFKPGAVVMLLVQTGGTTDRALLMCTDPTKHGECIDVAKKLYERPAQVFPEHKPPTRRGRRSSNDHQGRRPVVDESVSSRGQGVRP